MKKLISLIIAAASVFVTAAAMANEALLISKNKEFVIAYPDKPLPVEKTAADELAVHITKTTGAKAAALPENKLSAPDAAQAYVGRCAFTKQQKFYQQKLKQEEFQINVNAGKLFIYGDDQNGNPYAGNICTGTLFGVYDFIEKELGVAWLWPGELGEDIPAPHEILLKDFARSGSPGFMMRSMDFCYMKYEPANIKEEINVWTKRMKLSKVRKVWFGHSWDYYIFRKGMDKQHPEWLALWEGQRKRPHCCTSNKEFRDYIVEQCLTNNMNKDFAVVSISPSDGYGFCECEKCRALDPKGTDYSVSSVNFSDRHWDYANYVAKEVKKKNPNLGIGMFAYTAYSNPPANVDKLEDNIYVSFTFSEAYFVKPDTKKHYYELIDSWKSKGVKIIGREYWGMHYWMSLPFIFTTQIKEAMPYLYDRGLTGMYGETEKSFATQGPNYFLAAHLMWNPHADADKIMDRYYQGYGPAADAIRKYYGVFEQSILDNQDKIKDFSYREIINSWPEIFPEQAVVQAGKFLDEALAAASGNKIIEERVKFVAAGYEYTKVMVELLGIYRRLGRAGVPLNNFSRAGDLEELKHYKIEKPLPVSEEFWSRHPGQPLEKAERVRLLKRALFLGNERIRILNQYAQLPAVSLGMYKFTEDNKIRQWHLTVQQALSAEEATKGN